MKVSIVIPIYNEAENLQVLHEDICNTVDGESWDTEIVLVDDGSSDGSGDILAQIAQADPRCKVVSFTRNFGQTAAMAAGFEFASGEVIVPMDADLQNDPADIPRLLAKLEEGYDVVSGWRKNRKDRFITRGIPSLLANHISGWWTNVPLHDFGCSLKAYRATVLEDVHLYGEMHRFIPVYASWQGGNVTEIVVNHRARRHGDSKYGLDRTFKVMLDLLTMKLLGSYSTKPAYLFGGLGIGAISLGILTFLVAAVELIVSNAWEHRFTLVVLASFLAMIGVVLIMMGLLAELTVRIYHESQQKPIYILKKTPQPRSSTPGSCAVAQVKAPCRTSKGTSGVPPGAG